MRRRWTGPEPKPKPHPNNHLILTLTITATLTLTPTPNPTPNPKPHPSTPGKKSEYIDDDGNVIKTPGAQYEDNGTRKLY